MRQADITGLLPRVVQRSVVPGQPLDALLAVMEGLHAPVERLAAEVEQLARPWQAPDTMLPYLARWLDVDGVLAIGGSGGAELPGGSGQLRELIESAAQIAQWRGTARGLALFLGAATGIHGFVVEEEVVGDGGRARPFVIRVLVPPEASAQRPLIERVVQLAKPAYVQCLIVDARPAASQGDPHA